MKMDEHTYSDTLIDHFQNPRNVGQIESPDGYGKLASDECGDLMILTIKVDDGVITDAKFKTFGCAAAIASSSMLTEMIIGKPIDEALKITKTDVADALDGVPEPKLHCSLLAADALAAAIGDYRAKHSGE